MHFVASKYTQVHYDVLQSSKRLMLMVFAFGFSSAFSSGAMLGFEFYTSTVVNAGYLAKEGRKLYQLK